MPQRVRISQETFENLKEKIVQMGGRILGEDEKRKTYESIGLVPPKRRKRNLPEVGGIFFINGLIIFVWTSFVMKTNEDNWEDHGWVLIVCRERFETKEKKYFGQPKNRTKNFEDNLIRELELAIAHAKGRPNCSVCKRRMVIYKKYHQKTKSISVMWACFNKEKHEKPTFEDWDIGLSDEQQDFVKKRRKVRSKKRQTDLENGIERTPAKLLRKKWHINHPENQ